MHAMGETFHLRSPQVAPLHSRRSLLLAAAAAGLVPGCGGGGGGGDAPPPSGLPLLPRPPVVPVDGPAWAGFAGDAQHTALGRIATQSMVGFYWYTPLDMAPQMSTGALLTHYGSPVITRQNTVMLPVKTGATNGFRVDARVGATGDLMWSLNSDYILPPQRWVPSFNPVLTQPNSGLATRLFMPASGGRVLVRVNPDAVAGATSTLAFYESVAPYASAAATFDATVFINTPLTSDSAGNVFFGFVVTGVNPAGLTGGGIARISANGAGSYVLASAATADATLVKTATNAAPALSADEQTLYVVVNSVVAAGARANGRLLALNATTLATQAQVALNDPATGTAAWISDDATSSPLVGPDGDVYIGVLESASHNFRGWLLHFNAALSQIKTPGSFGWDNTPSIVPATMLGTKYTGSSSYLLLTKYNNYAGIGSGDGKNRIAILDPSNLTQADPITPAVTVMKEVITQLGPTPEAGGPAGAVREWCVNTAAVDPFTKSVLINSEDGVLYRWDLSNDTFSERITLNAGVAQSYTPTAIGPDGRIYAVNNAILHSIGQ
jgi:hypothetical protein